MPGALPSCRTEEIECDGGVEYPMKFPAQKPWLLFAIFAMSLALPVAYLIASIARWINWAAWLPVVLSIGFVAMGAAIRVNRMAQNGFSQK